MTGPVAGLEVVTIGTELLLGEAADSNAHWLSRRLAELGIPVRRRSTVSDSVAAIREAVAEALARTGWVICTGGLGPTPDDLTKAAVADLFGRRLVLDEAWLRTVQQRFRNRGLEMPEINRNQAEIPEGSRLLANPRGTAPGLVLEDPDRGVTILLPGVPAEMRLLMEQQVVPFLTERSRVPLHPVRSHTVRTTGISESALAERVRNVLPHLGAVSLGYLPGLMGEDLRLTAGRDLDEAGARAVLLEGERLLRDALGDHVYGVGRDDLANLLGQALRACGWTLAVAESCTGGLLAKRLTDHAGASEFFLGGFVTYANDAKTRFLGVRPATLEQHGAVSDAVAREMAEGARAAIGADCALAITGVAGPGGGSANKPVGTVHVAASVGKRTVTQHLRLPGDRGEIRERSAQAALALLFRELDPSS